MRPTRRISIADMMILVPAGAIGALLLRSYMPGFYRQLGYLNSVFPDPWNLRRVESWLRGPGSCLVVPTMAATMAIRLRRPRPRLVRLQPGFAACLAVMVSLLPGLAWYAAIRHRPGFQRPDSFEQAWSSITFWTGTAVVGAWLALFLFRRWRPEPSWIDRLGRALGLYWVLLFFASFALDWLQVLSNFVSRMMP